MLFVYSYCPGLLKQFMSSDVYIRYQTKTQAYCYFHQWKQIFSEIWLKTHKFPLKKINLKCLMQNGTHVIWALYWNGLVLSIK